MKYSEAGIGRVFVMRLENGDVIHEVIENFAGEKSITSGVVIIVGGAGKGSRLVVGPKNPDARVIEPMEILLRSAHEIVGTGTIFPDKNGKPVSHVHVAAGRRRWTRAGCIRKGVKIWLVAEVVIFELVNSTAKRLADPETGFELLEP
jgi:predicted DNA-binding protein with PD1-like motif